jgi:hypothetical protein
VELYGGDHEVSKACGWAGLHVGPVIELRLGVDLESVTVFTWLHSMIRAKRIRILLWEPPCTTFSPARFPKLRSKQASFGFSFADFDTCVGNLHCTMSCFLASVQAIVGHWHVGEQPWPGTMKYTPAWLYLQLLGARVRVFDWCRFGRAWKKATAIIGNADLLDQLELRCECPRSFKRVKLEGSLTTKASSYSPEFATAFAELARANLHQLCAGDPSPVCPEDPAVVRKARHVSHLWAVQLAETLPWTTNMIYKFGDGGHINLRGVRAYRFLIKRLPRDSKPAIGQDSKVRIGAFNKGRSPSAALNKIVVSIMLHVIGKNLHPCSFHQPTWGMRADAPSRLRAVEAPTAAIPRWFWQLSSGTHPSDLRVLDENSYTARGLGRWFQFGAFALGLVRAAGDEPEARQISRARCSSAVERGSERDHSPDQDEALGEVRGLVAGAEPGQYGHDCLSADPNVDKFLARVRQAFVRLGETSEGLCQDCERHGLKVPLASGECRGSVEAPNYMAVSGATGPAPSYATEGPSEHDFGRLDLGSVRMAIILLTGFFGLLSVCEALCLKVEDFSLPTDSDSVSAVYVRILEPKTERRGARHQYVRIVHRDAVCFLTSCLRNLPSSMNIWPCSTHIYTARFKTLLDALKLPKGCLHPSNLRPGGASFFFILWKENVQRLLWRGRWGSLKMLEHYVQELTCYNVYARIPAKCNEKLEKIIKHWIDVISHWAWTPQSLADFHAADWHFTLTSSTKRGRLNIKTLLQNYTLACDRKPEE